MVRAPCPRLFALTRGIVKQAEEASHNGRIKALGDLRRPPSGRHDLGEALRAVTAAAAATIARVDCADIVLIGKSTFEAHGVASSSSRELGRIQRDAGGPCIDAAGVTSVVYSSDLRSERRWPQFTEEALLVGVGSVLSFQLTPEPISPVR